MVLDFGVVNFCYAQNVIKLILMFGFVVCFFFPFHQGCQMPDTLNSWFLVAQLHVW